MNEDTIKLLKECNAGCKSATNSMEQVKRFIDNEKLKLIIDDYNNKHIKIGDECHQILNNYCEEEKDPPAMAKTYSWLSTQMKLSMKNNAHEIANIMIDGCNMGIKSVSEYINKYKAASDESIDLAETLVKIEQDFMNDLLAYM